MIFANSFSFDSAYAYNSESFAYINCVLKTSVGDLPVGQVVPEVIVNFKSSKIKLNVNGLIYTAAFQLGWKNDEVFAKDADADDSDFDCGDGDADESDADADSGSGSGSESDSSDNTDP